MSLSIYTNLSAMQAQQYLQTNTEAMDTSIQRLSSGLQINSAADNPAGSVISTQMNTQIQGMTQATQNTNDAINMLKTASSALDEITTQLQSIRTLTLQASTGTATASQQAADQAQVTQAMTDINNIASQTNFAGKNLLASDIGGNNLNNTTFQIGANVNQTTTLSMAANSANMLATDVNGLNLNTGASAFASLGEAFTGLAGTDTQTLSIKYTRADGTVDTYNVALNAANANNLTTAVATLNTAFQTQRPGGVDAQNDAAPALVASNNAGALKITLAAGSATAEQTSAANFTIDETAASNAVANGTTGVSSNGTAATLALNTPQSGTAGTSGAINLTTSTTGVLAQVDEALTKVSNLQVTLGAFQTNNLQSNLNTLSSSSQNTSASVSSIEDTNMAAEMVNFTKEQILTQAAQAMLTQANQAPGAILKMLGGG